MTEYPRVHISPGWLRGSVRPLSGSMTLTSTCGIARPTVDTRRSMESSTLVCVDTGDVSVIP
jgi:hypothetical protein